MPTAVMTDIHANREAFSACLADAAVRGVTAFVLLGDYVGYGAEPGWAVETVRDLVRRGAVAVRGNHEAALAQPDPDLNEVARAALDWTRQQLSPEQRAFLEALPLSAARGDALFVHASALEPGAFDYVTGAGQASKSFLATGHRLIFCGHVHAPQLYFMTATAKVASFDPSPGIAIPLTRPRRWLAVIGSVGQPRDGVPAACYGLFDEAGSTLTYIRVPYDAETAAAKVRAAGLPSVLADRLLRGR
jgi:diadenosine tetraphosphatase ApaH/serine/threonine PP2A family protein phosphatase